MRMTIMAEVNCSHRIAHGPLPLLSSSSFGPHPSSRRAASSSLSPDSAPVSRARSTSVASDVCHAHSSPRRSLPIREPPSRAPPACLPEVGPGYGVSVFPDPLALCAGWAGSRHSSVTSGSAFPVSSQHVHSPGYRTSGFRPRSVRRPPARSVRVAQHLLGHVEDRLLGPAEDDQLLAFYSGLLRQRPHLARRLPAFLREHLDELPFSS